AKGTAYIEREVRRMGLIPAGDNGTFFQAVPLYARSVDTTSQLSADGTPVAIGKDYFPVHPGGTLKSVNGAQLIYAGSTADSATMIPAAQAIGKVVFYSGPAANVSARYPGAVAFMTSRPDQQLTQLRAFISRSSQLMKSDEDTVIRRLSAVVPESSVPAFLGVALANARPGTLGRTLHGDIRYKNTDTPGRNVIAIVRGSDARLKNQYVALGAHSDHVGVRRGGPVDHDSLRAFNQIAERIVVARTRVQPGFPGSGLAPAERASLKVNVDSLRRVRPARLDSIHNGADDDGSGSVGLLEIAELFAGTNPKPKRSILFVWHTAEESGLFGSEYFTDHPTIPRDSIVSQINIDMIGRGEAADMPGGSPDYVQLLGARRLSTEFGDIIEKVNTTGKHALKLDYTFDADKHPEQLYCRSDHYEYARYGIPIVFMSTGGHADYHQVTDEPQYISYPHLARVATFAADLAKTVANMDHRPLVDKPKPDPKADCVQ
ncbi:MAG TPA: M28 family peptidase, partial [Gemmatimonadaceae bacterium]|nr:M28 family peptidase [Gemmatimonadaceae bacterium]